VRQIRDALAAMAEEEEARVTAAAAAEFRRMGGFDVPW
jgi:CHASE3 domain sensor protein